jgi:hypothetical protein
MDFLIAFLIIILVLLLVIKGGGKLVHLIVDGHPTRIKAWEWVKRLFWIGLAIPLLIASFERWYYFHDEISYGNKKQLNPHYASQIDAEVYLMSQENVIALFEGNPPNPDTRFIPERTYSQPYVAPQPADPRFFLVVRIRNHGDQAAWGVLNCFVGETEGWNVDIPPIPPEMQGYKNIVLLSNDISQGPYPKLELRWEQLYTMQGGK